MKNALAVILNSRKGSLAILVGLLVTLTLATARSEASNPTTAVTVTNNSSRDITAIYLSATTDDNWGPNQLSGSISPGGAQTFNISWQQSAVKLIAEDQDGCFLTTTADTSSAVSWTITSSSARNCGSGQ
jgi:hypothetical protein